MSRRKKFEEKRKKIYNHNKKGDDFMKLELGHHWPV